MRWMYQWLSNGGGDNPVDCALFVADETDLAALMPTMVKRFGEPRFFIHVKGPGIIWDNGGSWGIWVLSVEDD